jgi:nanoRNase/pAp phosphatase (c-di-AMP/oligoRNAs hydrolase)
MVGILGDTGRFLYKNKSHRNTFSVVSDLLDMGVKIESIHSEINSYSSNVIDLISVILANIKTNAGYTYSFIADSAKDKMVDQGLSEYEYSGGYHQALDQYIRNIDGNPWGFVVLPKYSDKGVYKCSFRANQDAGIDTSVFANALGGGGHSLASGCNFEAGSIEEAVEKVKTTVKEKYKEASK